MEPEMAFSNISLTKDWSLLFFAIHSSITGTLYRNHTLLWFQSSYKKSEKQENSILFMNNFCRTEKRG
jgi:hypothetical protein